MMKENKWVLPAECTRAAFFAGFTAGMSKTDTPEILNSVGKINPNAVKEECCNG